MISEMVDSATFNFHNQLDDQRNYPSARIFVAIGLSHQTKLYSVLCIDQFTMQYCVRPFYSVLKIFSK